MTAIHPFDLQVRAEAAARSLVALLDPQRDGLMYFLGDWRARPPRADHSLWDCGDGCGRLDLTAFQPRRVAVRLPSGITETLAVSPTETGDST